MRIFMAADHAGFELKEKVKRWLKHLGYLVYDEGAFTLNPDDDYPDFMHIVAKQVSSNPDENRGIIFGRSGEGEAMVVNRYPGVRAVVYYGGNSKILVLSREHNNANVLSIGAGFVGEIEALDAIKQWLDMEFPGEERHTRRLAKIDKLIPEVRQDF